MRFLASPLAVLSVSIPAELGDLALLEHLFLRNNMLMANSKATIIIAPNILICHLPFV